MIGNMGIFVTVDALRTQYLKTFLISAEKLVSLAWMFDALLFYLLLPVFSTATHFILFNKIRYLYNSNLVPYF